LVHHNAILLTTWGGGSRVSSPLAPECATASAQRPLSKSATAGGNALAPRTRVGARQATTCARATSSPSPTDGGCEALITGVGSAGPALTCNDVFRSKTPPARKKLLGRMALQKTPSPAALLQRRLQDLVGWPVAGPVVGRITAVRPTTADERPAAMVRTRCSALECVRPLALTGSPVVRARSRQFRPRSHCFTCDDSRRAARA
jgi:hypothetical protein